MRFSITAKLVFAMLGVTVLVLAATLALAWWSFRFGFLNYINAQEQSRIEQLAERAVEWYEPASGRWAALTSRDWRILLEQGRPQSGGPERRHRRPPPHGAPPPRRGGSERRGPPGPRGPSPGPNTWLVNAMGTTLAGNPTPPPWLNAPIRVNDIVVGEVRTQQRREFGQPLELAFAGQQLTATGAIAALALLLATLIALVLARTLLAPVKRMILGVDELAAGQYESRLNLVRDDELGELTRNIDRLADSLESNRSARRRWLADISHELRTPISVLHAELEAVRDGVRQLDGEQIDSFTQEVSRLVRLSDDLYDLALTDVGGLRYEFAPLDLAELTRSFIDDFGSRYPSLKCSVSAASPCTVRGDEARLSQLLTNLLHNACTYTDPPGPVKASVTPQGSGVLLTIEDGPPGVASDALGKLFEPLFREDPARDRRRGGAGLGLAICANIVAAHEGRIEARPSDLGGICIEVWLPAL